MKYILGFVAAILSPALFLSAQVSFAPYENLFTTPLSYQVFQTTDSITIDGLLKEDSWQNCNWSSRFVDIEGDRKPKPTYNTRFKMLWDERNLYVAVEIEEPHIWATLSQHDTIVYHDNDFEIFIDPDGDTHNYFEIEVNAFKTVFDLFMNKPYRNRGNALINWNVGNLKVGVNIEGTINKANDKDRKWTIEFAIPFRSISLGSLKQKPVDQTIWRMNFSRVEWDTEIINNAYRRKKDPVTGRVLPEHNWVWTPQGVINMHFPERWGYVQFIAKKAGSSTPSFQIPAAENLKRYLWLIYYKQHDFYKSNTRFAGSLNQLFSVLSYAVLDEAKLEGTTNLFQATIKDQVSNQTWQINQDGEIRATEAKK